MAPWFFNRVNSARMNTTAASERRVAAWRELLDLFDSGTYRSWAFRGQPDASWPLETPLARYLRRSGVRPEHWAAQEGRILRIFRRKAHLHLRVTPDERDSFEWLALMQHHGAPTRLLDFTWSPFVAAFYALANPAYDVDAAIWAIKPAALHDHNEKYGPWVFGNYEKYFLPGKNQTVVVGEPHRMNQRLIAHSGTFAIPGRLDVSVDAIMSALAPAAITKIILPSAMRREAMSALYTMNITDATLFPDLDGLARSLGIELELHWQFDPVTGTRYV
jgi:hypothetical protein